MKQPHSRTQQFILQTTSRAAGVFITTQQPISAFHFRSLCSVTINNDLVETMYKIDSFPSRQFGSISVSLLHSLYSSLFYAMNVHYSHTNDIICPSHSTID